MVRREGKDAEIDRRVDHADQAEAHRLEHDGALMPGGDQAVDQAGRGSHRHRLDLFLGAAKRKA